MSTNSSEPNIYTYTNSSFFPLNWLGFGNWLPTQNFHFTFEIHAQFTYQGGETLRFFSADDDLWLFIDNKLVVDLGGIHPAEQYTLAVDKLQLTVGTTYLFDMFYNERRTTQADLGFQTSIRLTCGYYDHCGVCQGDGQSCCTYCPAPANDCTVARCDVVTGGCTSVAIPCGSSETQNSASKKKALLTGLLLGLLGLLAAILIAGLFTYRQMKKKGYNVKNPFQKMRQRLPSFSRPSTMREGGGLSLNDDNHGTVSSIVHEIESRSRSNSHAPMLHA